MCDKQKGNVERVLVATVTARRNLFIYLPVRGGVIN